MKKKNDVVVLCGILRVKCMRSGLWILRRNKEIGRFLKILYDFEFYYYCYILIFERVFIIFLVYFCKGMLLGVFCGKNVDFNLFNFFIIVVNFI